ncbi:MAG TPA: hypothetical protein VFZ87_00365, partial [Gemmatimonadales bacterium]
MRLPGSPLELVEVAPGHGLQDYEDIAHLAPAAAEFRAEASGAVKRLTGRTVWMVSSTAAGGGVAEMLAPLVRILRDIGVRTQWAVIGSRDPAFFELTKRLHNLIHGTGDPKLTDSDRDLFQRVNRENAAGLRQLVRPGDVLVVHDPQPLPLAALLREAMPLHTIWRSHIGLDSENTATRAAWGFLAPHLGAYDHAVFSAPEYIPEQLAGRSTVIHPGVDPLSPKNRELALRETVEVLCNGGLIPYPSPTVHGPFPVLAQRVGPDGALAPAYL